MRHISSTIGFEALFFYPSADQTIGPCLARSGEFARAEVDFLRDHLPPAGVLYDVGANIGTVSIPLARSLPDLSVYAFEPQLPVYRLLLRNIAVNGLFSVEAFPWALGERDGLIEFATPALTEKVNFGSVGRGNARGEKLPVVLRRLDALGLPAPHLVKIDVEGFDLEVVKGARETIRAARPIVFCEAHASPKTVELMGLLQEWDYDLYWFFAPFTSAAPDQRGPVKIVGDANIAAFPKEAQPRWPLPRVERLDENWKDRVSEFTYMKRYGYTL